MTIRLLITSTALALCAHAWAAPAPLDGPAPDPVLTTLITVEDLLARFEETAASHHVLLVNDAAARREASLRLARLGIQSGKAGNLPMARRCLGWASAFPGTWWYSTILPVHEQVVLMDAAAACEEECAAMTTCTSGARRDEHASEWEGLKRRAVRRPHIEPNAIAPAGLGFESLLDFIHYPPETFAVTIESDGVRMGGGEVHPGATTVHSKPGLGTYRVTAQLSGGPVTHEYRAAALTADASGFMLNGERHVLKACRFADVEGATRDTARGIIEDLLEKGYNLGVVTTPPLWLIELADQMAFGLAVEPALSGPDGACAVCCGGAGVSGLQDRVTAHIRRYAEAPAVRLWVAAPVQAQDAELVLESIYALYGELDVYKRPALYLGALDARCTARDAIALEDAIQETAKDLPRVAVSNAAPGSPEVEALWQAVNTQGCAGMVAGSVSLAGGTP
jgi:hypothetical protein